MCDRGNHRVSVYALHGFVLLHIWRAPPAAGLSADWEPYGIAFDSHGRVYVSDTANLAVHRLSLAGQWEKSWSVGAVGHLAVDCRDRACAVLSGPPPTVVVLDENGGTTEVTSTVAADLASEFPPPPFAAGPNGELYLESIAMPGACPEPRRGAAAGVFGADGSPMPDARPLPAPAYVPDGTFHTTALDSQIYRCQWHRVILSGDLPRGTSVEVATFTAEMPLTDEDIAALPGKAWETCATATAFDRGTWDALVRSGPARWLWLRLTLRGQGDATPAITCIEIEFPRISLRRYLPAVYSADPISADFTDRFLAIFDTALRSIETRLDTQAALFDPLSAPAADRRHDFLSWLGTWIGIAVDRTWPDARRRQYLKRAAEIYDVRGTPQGLWRQLVLYLGLDPDRCCCPGDNRVSRCVPRPRNCAPEDRQPCRWRPPRLVLEHFKLRRWLFVGEGTLGNQAVLWGKRIVNRMELDAGGQVGSSQLVTTPDPLRDPFHVYAHRFTVFVPAGVKVNETMSRGLERLIAAESPAGAQWDVRYVEPRFRIGVQSMIGLDSVIARVPRGVTLGDTPLGPASVLGPPPHAAGPPQFAVGRQARIGSTTRIE